MRTLLAAVTLLLALTTPALADGPGSGTPTVVTLGDSAISGEAGRWAGNTNQSSSRVTRSAQTHTGTRRPARRSADATAPSRRRPTSAAA
jgi:hypothetical protein